MQIHALNKIQKNQEVNQLFSIIEVLQTVKKKPLVHSRLPNHSRLSVSCILSELEQLGLVKDDWVKTGKRVNRRSSISGQGIKLLEYYAMHKQKTKDIRGLP